MHYYTIIGCFTILSLGSIGGCQSKTSTTTTTTVTPNTTTTTASADIEIPIFKAYQPIGQQVKHTYYTLFYNNANEQADWVAYKLTKTMVNSKNAQRLDNFREDPAVTDQSANPNDYRGSGYDRGHLCPAADMKTNENAMSETFFMSNMSPQEHAMNTGCWNNLEDRVRDFARWSKEIYVVTGPILYNQTFSKKIGKTTKVVVPNLYYKAILDYTEPDIKAIGFVMENKGSEAATETFAISIDELEQKTGIDFFSTLPDNVENKIEASFNYADWLVGDDDSDERSKAAGGRKNRKNRK